MTEADDWSAPSLYTGGRPINPPLMAGADPMFGGALEQWFDSADSEPVWGTTTYRGPRWYRPREPGEPEPGYSPGPGTATVDPIDLESRPGSVAPDELAGAGAATAPASAGAPPRDRGLMANSRTMAVASLASRITGFLRNAMLAAAIGVGHVGDAYNLANNLPNMVYELLLGGVLSSVLVPLLVRAQEDDADDGVGYTQRLLAIGTAALGAATLVVVAAAPLFTDFFVPVGSERSIASIWATLLLPEIFFYGIGAMLMAVLNVRHSYGPGAWSPLLNNVIMIVTICVYWLLPGPHTLSPASITDPQLLVLGVGTTLGIAAQALVLVPALRGTGFQWKWRFRARPNEHGRLRQVGALAAWVLGYVVASQIGVSVIAKVGVAHSYAFTVFTNADLLVQMPYGILVVSLLTALMPRLSRAAARGQTDAVIDDLSLGARLSAVALLPITAAMIALGPVLTIVLFSYGQTSIAHGHLIGVALADSAFGLFPFAMVMLQLRVFYAMHDGRTPTLINVFMVATKVAMVLVGERLLHGESGFAQLLTVSTSASYVVGAVVGHIALSRRLGRLHFGPVVRTVALMLIASAVGGVLAWGIQAGWRHALGLSHTSALLGLVVGGVAGLAVMGAVAWLLRVPEVRNLRAAMGRGG